MDILFSGRSLIFLNSKQVWRKVLETQYFYDLTRLDIFTSTQIRVII